MQTGWVEELPVRPGSMARNGKVTGIGLHPLRGFMPTREFMLVRSYSAWHPALACRGCVTLPAAFCDRHPQRPAGTSPPIIAVGVAPVLIINTASPLC